MNLKYLLLLLSITTSSAQAGNFGNVSKNINKGREPINSVKESLFQSVLNSGYSNSQPGSIIGHLPKGYQHLSITGPAYGKSLNLQSEYPLVITLISPTTNGRSTPCKVFVSDQHKSVEDVENFYATYAGSTIQLFGVQTTTQHGVCLFDSAAVYSK